NDYRAIYTWPQTTKNQAALVALNGRYSVTDHWTVQSNLYYRRFNQEHVDGNAAEIERCSGAANNPLFNTLCLENDAFPQPRPPAAGFQILNQNGQPIPCPPGSGNTCATTPWGTVDRTFTKGLTTGASLQALTDDKMLGHDNYFVIGASVDRSKIGFLGNSELGFIYPDLFVGPNAAIPGTGQIIHTAADIGFSPVSLAAWQTYYGAYFNETFDSVETSTPAAVAATGSSGCSIPTAKTTLFKSRASSKAEACFRTFHLHAAKGWKRVPTTNRDNTSSTPIMLSSMLPISSVESWPRRTILSQTRMETSSLLPASRFPAYRGTWSKEASTIGLRRS